MFDVLKYVTETAAAYDTEPRSAFRGGQLVQPGPGRPGYGGLPVYTINEENFKLLDDLIPNTELTINEIKVRLGGEEKSGNQGINKLIDAWEASNKKRNVPKERFRPYKLTQDSPKVQKVLKEYKKLGSKKAVEQSTGIPRKMQRHIFKKFKPEEIKPANIAGPETGAKELKKRREKIIKELRQHWKGQKGGELILKQMDKKLADIAAENKSILKMSDDAIWKNKKYQDAMRLNVKALKTGEGLKFDRYQGISKKDFAKSVRDLAAKGEFVQPEHLISLKNKDPKSLLPKNIFPAYGKVGGQMEVLKDFSKANTIGKRPTEIFNFLKGQNIPIERPGLWKATKKGASKVGKALFGPVEMGVLPLFLAGEGLYNQYANKRDLRKALERDGKMSKDEIEEIVATYGQESADLGDVGLEDWAIEQRDTTPFKESLAEIDITMPQMRQDLNRTIEYERALQDQEYQKQLEEAQRERYDPYAPMAGGGIAGLSGGKRFGPPPESGPMPQGGGLSSQFNRVRKLTG